jgi:hypothetical protein
MDQAQFELEAEFNARYDYITEAFADMNDTPEMLAQEAQANFEDWCVEQQDAMEARGGPRFQVDLTDDCPF